MDMDKQRIITHFTDAEGVKGITGLEPSDLTVGNTVTVNQIRFGVGRNPFNALNPGDIFVTELAPDATSRQLSFIGARGAKQQYAISFSDEDAFNSGTRVLPSDAEKNIFVIPANSVVNGVIEVVRRF